MLLQHAVQNDMFVHQMDVKTAYLNAPIDCEIFMEQPEGYKKAGKNFEKLVYKLRKSLYGIKQSGRNWNNMLHEYLLGENLLNHLLIPVFTLVIVAILILIGLVILLIDVVCLAMVSSCCRKGH